MSDKDGLYKAYESHSNTLKAWLVAYGIGAPILFLTNEEVWSQLVGEPESRWIAMAFLLGVALQVILSSINKNAVWFCYRGEDDSEYQNKRIYKISCWIMEQYWLDVLVDVATIFLFAWATFSVFEILFAGT